MTNEELEREIKRLEEQIKDLKVKLEEKIEKKPYEVEVPEDIGNYYTVNRVGCIQKLNNESKFILENMYRRGLIFKTREEAEQFDKERILLFKLHQWAEEHNEGWTPDLNDYNEKKYFVEYNSYYEPLGYNYCRTLNFFSKLPYFKSEEIVRQFIDEFGDEIKEVLC